MSKTSPMGSVIRAFDLQSGYQLCKGGSANLARGLMETFIAAGERFAPQVELDRIVIDGGKHQPQDRAEISGTVQAANPGDHAKGQGRQHHDDNGRVGSLPR